MPELPLEADVVAERIAECRAVLGDHTPSRTGRHAARFEQEYAAHLSLTRGESRRGNAGRLPRPRRRAQHDVAGFPQAREQLRKYGINGKWGKRHTISERKRHSPKAKPMAASDLVVAITGASGSAYAIRLLDVLLRAGRTIHLIISPAATEVFDREIGRSVNLDPAHFDPKTLLGERSDFGNLKYHNVRNFQAGIASGSFLTGGMVICPCSMGTVAAIARGLSENLIHRAADVHLKERRKLIVVPRETPLGLVQLKNLVAIAEAGAVVLPAMPAFYTLPKSVDDMVDFVVSRICDQLGVESGLAKRWGAESG